jgi:hypothetical protein
MENSDKHLQSILTQMTKSDEKGAFEPQYLEIKFKTKLMNKRAKAMTAQLPKNS